MIQGPPPLQRPPTGLLGFFGIKNGGKNPGSLGDVLLPTFRTREIYEASNFQFFNQRTFLGGVPAFIFNLTVPQGELWHVLFYNVLVTTFAGDAFSGYVGYRDTPTSLTGPMSPSITLGANSAASTFVPQDLWLTSGESLGVQESVSTNASGTAFHDVHYRYIVYPA